MCGATEANLTTRIGWNHEVTTFSISSVANGDLRIINVIRGPSGSSARPVPGQVRSDPTLAR